MTGEKAEHTYEQKHGLTTKIVAQQTPQHEVVSFPQISRKVFPRKALVHSQHKHSQTQMLFTCIKNENRVTMMLGCMLDAVWVRVCLGWFESLQDKFGTM